MARITLNSSAPEGAGTFGFGPEVLDVTNGPVDTDNAAVIADASRHPWLDVDTNAGDAPTPAIAGTPESDDSFDDFDYGEDN